MAEKKISQLTAKGAEIADTDLIVISESAGGGTYVSKSATGANVKALVTDANLTTTDITTNNVSTAKHGFVPKAPNDATQFLDGTGAFDTVKDSDLSLSDITTNDVSTTKHGFAPKAPNDTAKFLRGDATWATVPAGGLTKFTEAESTASPNNTVYVDSLTAAGSTTNVDVAIVPKGTGALLANIPDNTTTGGNKRGANASDLQTLRSAATQVASGTGSFSAGAYGTASGTWGVTLGYLSSATASRSFAAQEAIASGTLSFAFGARTTASGSGAVAMSSDVYTDCVASGNNSFASGAGNTSSGTGSVTIGGSVNTANATNSYAFGSRGHVFGVNGRMVKNNSFNNVAGECQKSIFNLGVRTTGNTATTLTVGGGAASTNNQVILSNQSAYRFKGTIIGKKSGTTDTAAWDIDGLIVRGANAAATTLVVSNVNVVDNTPAWGTPTLAADTTNGGLQVQVTGAATTNIQWTAVIETTEVIYA